MSDLITICIPTYRRPSILMHCLHSCLIQDYRPLEIDISDNSPNDDTRAVVEALTPPDGITIRYWRNSPTIGPVENHKKLFAAARGRRFVWMNDDDVLLPGAVSAMADAFSLAPDVIATFGLEELINPDGEVLRQETELSNIEYQRLRHLTGLRRDLLVSAFWQQISHVGYMVLTDAARKVGLRDRSEIGLAVDVDFTIRLAQAYKGTSHVFLDRMTVQSRIAPTTLSQTSTDVAWKLYDFAAAIDDLSPDEADARDLMLKRIAPNAIRENAVINGWRAALRILRSPPYPCGDGMLRSIYGLGLVVMPHFTFLSYRLVKSSFLNRKWFSALRRHRWAGRSVFPDVTPISLVSPTHHASVVGLRVH